MSHSAAASLDPLPVLSLFSGAGGLDLGFEDRGFLPVLALDNDSAAVNTYNYNRYSRGPVARRVDLADVDSGSVLRWWAEASGGRRPAGIIGGPPCQAFSIGNAYKITDDPRARLPLAYARLLKRRIAYPLAF